MPFQVPPCPALGHQHHLAKSMDHPVAPQRPQGGKGHIIVLFAEVENIGLLQMAVQSIRHNADDLAAAIQAAGLGSLIGSFFALDFHGNVSFIPAGGISACRLR